MLKVKVDGKINEVWSYLEEQKQHSKFRVVFQELIDQKFTNDYIQVMCYMQPDSSNREQTTVCLHTLDGQQVKIPLSNVTFDRFGNKVFVTGTPACEVACTGIKSWN